jgi:hypothetical protein
VSHSTLTVLTPWFNEVANVGVLAERVAAALADQAVEYRQRQRGGRLEAGGWKLKTTRWTVGLQTETGDRSGQRRSVSGWFLYVVLHRRREAESRWAVDSLSVISAERG